VGDPESVPVSGVSVLVVGDVTRTLLSADPGV
jgi:hypothetical protein